MDCPRLVLDPTGRERDAETAELCARGPATPVDILGVEAWAVADPGLLELLLKDPRVSKDGHRHWPDFPKVVPTWPLAVWVTARDTEGEGEAAALTEQELRDTLLLVVSAGYETTVNLIDNGIALLLTHPDQLAEVRAGRARWSDVVEEALRHDAPVAHLPLRYAVEDIRLSDEVTIRRGEAILAAYAAAGRHPCRYGDTGDAFDVTRPVKDHLAFGHGPHFCLGAPLARMEAETALRRLFERFPDLALAPGAELAPVASLISNGHRSLPVLLAGLRVGLRAGN
ncbi:hypothetical protein P3T27_004917 [Kitasatospora sp. MAA19]|uniref:cytochrome P450 n=1 Tax=Kitasatospora sp. MAA19 TaxID=3035090 RepID=UPI002474E6C6|nr:cytochrome P450 [Kitasatospora sp. MAA19]MDH6708178.1 hypothetical protein [Kitasatospora sp. MAA19]